LSYISICTCEGKSFTTELIVSFDFWGQISTNKVKIFFQKFSLSFKNSHFLSKILTFFQKFSFSFKNSHFPSKSSFSFKILIFPSKFSNFLSKIPFLGIIPSILFLFGNVLGFSLPAECGEKITLRKFFRFL
jgi:hypothetical protein